MRPQKPECQTPWQRKWLKLQVTSPTVQTMADEAEALCARWFARASGPRTLILTGAPGTGKTHTAHAVAYWARRAASSAWEAGHHSPDRVPDVLFLRWPQTCDGFKEGNYGVIEDAAEASLLILDDVGAEHDPSHNAADKLCQILTRREAPGDRRFTLVTTNISPEEWAIRLDARIADRFLRNARLVDLRAVASYAEARR